MTKTTPPRPVVQPPALGATAGVSPRLAIPVWISSAALHGLLLAAFYLILTLLTGGSKLTASIDAPAVSEPLNTRVDEVEKLPSDISTIGDNPELTPQLPVPRIEDVVVPGPVNPMAAPGIVDAPEGPRRDLPSPPGINGGTAGPKLLEPGSAAMFGPVGGLPGGINSPGSFGARLASGSTREQILQINGGNTASEAAVSRGLEWLALHQAPDGRWSLHEFPKHGRDKPWPGGQRLGDCGCTGVSSRQNDAAATAFGLLPFLGYGYTHRPATDPKRKDYSKNIEAGLRFLIRNQKADGYLGLERNGEGAYAHGLATIALCEAYGLTNDTLLQLPAQKAINYILQAQDPDGGGWRYAPKRSGDLSVSGWDLMALKSGQMAGLSVPKRTLDKTEQFWTACTVRENSDSNKKGKLHGFSYLPKSQSSFTMTAVGLLGLQYMGATPANRDLLDGVEVLKRYPPGRTNSPYYEYYATQVMHHMGGESWQFWNLGPDGKSGIRQTLIDSQDKGLDAKRVHQFGSWTPVGNAHGNDGGRIMWTSLNLLSLEVYYRHLPLYRRELATVKE